MYRPGRRGSADGCATRDCGMPPCRFCDVRPCSTSQVLQCPRHLRASGTAVAAEIHAPEHVARALLDGKLRDCVVAWITAEVHMGSSPRQQRQKRRSATAKGMAAKPQPLETRAKQVAQAPTLPASPAPPGSRRPYYRASDCLANVGDAESSSPPHHGSPPTARPSAVPQMPSGRPGAPTGHVGRELIRWPSWWQASPLWGA